eukprot:2013073-Rhodomonas_salina.3
MCIRDRPPREKERPEQGARTAADEDSAAEARVDDDDRCNVTHRLDHVTHRLGHVTHRLSG